MYESTNGLTKSLQTFNFFEVLCKFTIPVGSISTILTVLYERYKVKDCNDDISITKDIIEYLKEKLEEEREELEHLKITQVKTIPVNSNNLQPIKVNDKEALNNLKKSLLLFDLGIKMEKLIELLYRGKLASSLKNRCSDEEIEYIEGEVTEYQLKKQRG
jgi:hypothetical protein